MGLSTRLKLANLMLITDLRDNEDEFRKVVSESFAGGVDVLQIRDPYASAKQLKSAVEVAREIASDRDLVTLAHRLGPAVDAAADGFHLMESEDPRSARVRMHEWALVGRSTRQVDDIAHAAEGVDYVLVGPVFGAETEQLELVKAASDALPVTDPAVIPWFAAGAISTDNVSQVLDAGAKRIAVGQSILSSADPRATARELRACVRQVWEDDPVMERVVLNAFGNQTSTFKDDESDT